MHRYDSYWPDDCGVELRRVEEDSCESGFW